MPVSSAGEIANVRPNEFDRWFFTATAVLYLVVAVVGFAPNSMAILSGSKENPGLAVHVHAAVMFSWLLLFVVQASLIGQGRPSTHARLGQSLFVLGPVILILMLYLAVTRFPGGEQGPVIIAIQTERIVLFASFLTGAAYKRKVDSSAHKRLILLATCIPLDAAFNRMPWLPGGTPFGMLALLIPIVIYDLAHLGRLHRVTALCGGLVAAFWIAVVFWIALIRS
jgi:hypothetical protein